MKRKDVCSRKIRRALKGTDAWLKRISFGWRRPAMKCKTAYETQTWVEPYEAANRVWEIHKIVTTPASRKHHNSYYYCDYNVTMHRVSELWYLDCHRWPLIIKLTKTSVLKKQFPIFNWQLIIEEWRLLTSCNYQQYRELNPQTSFRMLGSVLSDSHKSFARRSESIFEIGKYRRSPEIWKRDAIRNVKVSLLELRIGNKRGAP